MASMTRRKFFTALAVATIGGVLTACGRKNAPKYPAGSVYPRKYPYDPDKATDGKD